MFYDRLFLSERLAELTTTKNMLWNGEFLVTSFTSGSFNCVYGVF